MAQLDPTDIVYATFGPAHSSAFKVSRQTWLSGKAPLGPLPFIFVPDKPAGPFAEYFEPLPDHGVRGVDHLSHTPVDANMLRAALRAKRDHPRSKWIFVVDSDAYVLPAAVHRLASKLDWRQRWLIGQCVPRGRCSRNLEHPCEARPGVSSAQCAASAEHRCQPANLGDGNDLHCRTGSCTCPVRPLLVHDTNATSTNATREVYVRDETRGQAHYTAATSYPFGGTGVLISTGLLDAAPLDTWHECTRRLVCGSADYRLAVCARSVANASTTHAAHNEGFFEHVALAEKARTGNPVGWTVRSQALWVGLGHAATRKAIVEALRVLPVERWPLVLHRTSRYYGTFAIHHAVRMALGASRVGGLVVAN